MEFKAIKLPCPTEDCAPDSHCHTFTGRLWDSETEIVIAQGYLPGRPFLFYRQFKGRTAAQGNEIPAIYATNSRYLHAYANTSM